MALFKFLRKIRVEVLALCVMFMGCAKVDTQASDVVVQPPDEQPSVLAEIAYDDDTGATEEISRIMIGDSPYLVLTDDEFDGHCLLLREYLLDVPQIYNEPDEFASYYPGSSIDRFLEEDFFRSLPKSVQDKVDETEIEVTDRSALYVGGDNTTTISRHVFLLSFSNLEKNESRTNLNEGEHIPYFNSPDRRIACTEDGTPGSWWTRTPNTSAGNIVCGVSDKGIVGIGGIYNPNEDEGYQNGVRPALCMDGDTEIVEITSGVFGLEKKELKCICSSTFSLVSQ